MGKRYNIFRRTKIFKLLSGPVIALLAILTVGGIYISAEINQLKNYRMIHTRGIVDVWEDMYNANKENVNWKDYKDGEWCAWGNWQPDGLWNSDGDDLEKYGITLPKFSWITTKDYPVSIPRVYGRAFYSKSYDDTSEVDVRQRAHTSTHTLFCVPGTTIKLYPYTEYGQRMMTAYNDSLNRWYDYSTDLKSDNLTFTGDYECIETPFGHLGGTQPQKFREGVTIEINSVDEYIEYAKAMKETGKNADANFLLRTNLNFAGKTDVPPFGTFDHPFRGVFDGQGHTVSNLTVKCTDAEYQMKGNGLKYNSFIGMFGKVGGGAEIRNLHVDSNCLFKGYTIVGFIGGGDGTGTEDKQIYVENIFFEGTIVAYQNCACIFGRNEGKDHIQMSNICTSGKLKRYWNEGLLPVDVIGAFIGFSSSGAWRYVRIENCLNVNKDISAYAFCYNWNSSNPAWNPNPHQGIYAVKCYSLYPDDTTAAALPKDAYGNTYALNSTQFRDNLGSRNWIIDSRYSHVIPTVKSVSHLPGTVANFAYTAADQASGNLDADGFIPDKYICLDISQTFDNYVNIDQAKKTVTEPIVAFRHIFRVVDARRTSEKYTKTPEGNREYINMNRRTISARANDNFQIRLDFALPTVPEWGTTYSSRFYYAGKNNYQRFNRTVIESRKLVDIQGGGAERKTIYTADSNGEYKCTNEAEGIYEHIGEGENYAGQRYSMGVAMPSGFFHEAEPYQADDGKFARMLACENPEAGIYVVKIYAANNSYNKIYTVEKGADGKTAPIQVAELFITFLPEDEASFVTEKLYDDIKKNSSDVRYPHTEKFLEENCKEIPPIIIDFDEYALLETHDSKLGVTDNDFIKTWETIPAKPVVSDANFESGKYYRIDNGNGNLGAVMSGSGSNTIGGKTYYEVVSNSVTDKVSGTPVPARYFKWPVPWELSDYGFGYADRQEYNMYAVANHSFATIYHGATTLQSGFSRVNFREVNADGSDKLDSDGNPIVTPLYLQTNSNLENILYRSDNWVGGDGLYDRRFYNSGGAETGYFYYVNAASDPGVIRNITIDEPCEGTIIHVSAWLSEFSRAEETANLILNFQAVMDDHGTDVVNLHSFTTGYVQPDDCGNWMHIYYSFVYNKAMLGDRTPVRYQLTLENNAKNSHGADYAVDDIRLYLTHPNVEARQLTSFCKRDVSADVQIGIDFETLLATVGVAFAELSPNEQHDIYYAFLDYDKYADYKDGKRELKDCFLNFNYDGGTKISFFGKQTFNTHFELNPASNRSEWGAGRNMFIFNANPQDADMVVGKKYYVVMYLPHISADEDDQPFDESGITYANFHIDPENPESCGKYGVFTVQPSAVVNLNGIAMASATDIYVCPNQRPIVTVSLRDPGDEEKIQKDVYVDWYEGSLKDFDEEKTEKRTAGSGEEESVNLAVALNRFRLVYGEGTLDGVEIKDTPIEESGSLLTKEMLELLRKLVDNGKLHLYRKEYPYTNVLKGVDRKFVITPIDLTGVTETGTEFNVCMDPIEITVHYQEPSIDHGFSQIPYPEGMDVPLRMGLGQIDEISVASGDDINIDSPFLSVPLRSIRPVTEGYTQLRKYQEGEKYQAPAQDICGSDYWFDLDPELTLVATDDPAFRQFAVESDSPETSNSDDSIFEIGPEICVGEVFDMDAQFDGTGAEDEIRNSASEIRLIFYKKFRRLDASGNAVAGTEPIRFREGYIYKLRFKFSEYREDGSTVNSQGEDTKLPPCGGSHDFSLKIVADYQKWTGKELPDVNNWNNDENWTRIGSDELMLPTGWANAADGDKMTEYVTDGNNDNRRSFAPLDFTKVIVPGISYQEETGARQTSVPELYESASEPQKLYKDLQLVRTVFWHRNPTPAPESGISPFTPGDSIQYDLVARVRRSDVTDRVESLQCEPWYMNTCKEIHFMAESELGNQRMLNYEKAWVDVQLEHDKWYTLASPLQQVVAGDWYLPTDGAREHSQLFRDIRYDETKNHRFHPAVYQRAWNRAVTRIFEYGEASPSNGIDRLMKSSWSHVYNDVEVDNGSAGLGFSIKADAATADNWNAGIDRNSDSYNKVLFRLPKADAEYDYYQNGYGDPAAEDNNKGHHTSIGARDNRNRLQAYDVDETGELTTRITGTAVGSIHEDGESSEYFLVGNPFMAHLDMAEFLVANSDRIEPQFWIMDGDSQKAAVMTGTGLVEWQADKNNNPFLYNGNGDDCRYLAPMQGFFVKAKGYQSTATERTLSLTFDETWTKVNLESVSRPVLKTRGESAPVADGLRISAIVDDMVASQAMIHIDAMADADFCSGEDVEFFDDDTQKGAARVFTFAGDMASLINVTPYVKATELALLAPAQTCVQLRFEGADNFDELYLYDALLNSVTPIFDGMEYEATGDIKSRLYITAGTDMNSMAEAIRIMAVGREVTVLAPETGRTLRVEAYDMKGHTVCTVATDSNEAVFELPEGVYAVRATNETLSATAKVIIR